MALALLLSVTGRHRSRGLVRIELLLLAIAAPLECGILLTNLVAEFWSALKSRYTYDPFRNLHTWLGFSWGLGSLLLWLLFTLEHASATPAGDTVLRSFEEPSIARLLCLCPFVFAVTFGALGTIRQDRSRRVGNTLSILGHEVSQRTSELIAARGETVLALSRAIEAKDPYTRGHCIRVWKYAERAGIQLCLSESELEELRIACYLHDIGKIRIPGLILNKPGRLTAEDRDIIAFHPAHGERIISQISGFKRVARLVLCHHERCDGSGYPAGLKGDQIPFLAKIMAVADSLDALTSTRPYRAGLDLESAIEEMRRCAGLPFDPSRIRGGDRESCLLFDPEIVECMTEGLESVVVVDEELACDPMEALTPKRQLTGIDSVETDLASGRAPAPDSLEATLELPAERSGCGATAQRLNCWELRGCGMEAAARQGEPSCPVVAASHINGTNGGHNGGRVCWAIVGAMCGCSTRSESVSAEGSQCLDCGFFQRVQREEGLARFVIFPEILRGGLMRW